MKLREKLILVIRDANDVYYQNEKNRSVSISLTAVYQFFHAHRRLITTLQHALN